MKEKVLLAAVAAFLFSSITIFAGDPPHNSASDVNCSDCHGMTLLDSQSPFWTDNTTDAAYCAICLRCHTLGNVSPYNAINAPPVVTHQEIKCTTCHHNHGQDQIYTGKNNRDDFFLATGTAVSAVYDSGSDTTTITYSLLEATDPGSDWASDLTLLAEKTGSGRGGLLIPDTTSRKRWPLYIIVAIDDPALNTIKVKGNATAATNFAIMYGQLIRGKVLYDPVHSSSRSVKLYNQEGAYAFAHDDGQGAGGIDSTPNGNCQVCHESTNHWRNDGSMTENHYSGQNCMRCHPHTGGFLHGGGAGGTGCIECHGHDAGTLYDPSMMEPYEAGTEASIGAGTFQSHSTHTEIDIDDLKGPGIYCDTCHDIDNFPYFKTGTDGNGDGLIELSETDVCDTCHSGGGTYDGLDDPIIGARQIWSDGAYAATDDSTLRSGKAKWCAACHDDSPSQIQSVNAPNVIGEESGSYTYGTGWGYYKTGHGLDSSQSYPASGGIFLGAGKECDNCHDYSTAHVDGKARSFDCGDGCDADEYREEYRLSMVNGRNPMEIPLATNIAPNANNYMLCFSNNGCHLPDKYLSKSTDLETVFRDDQGDPPAPNSPYVTPVNAHDYHLNFKVGMNNRMVPDWRTTVNGTFSCTVCHNVHGSTQLAMVRDGKLVSQTPGINREPGMKVLYTTVDDYETNTEPTPANLTLDASVGTFWDGNTSDNLCSDCHGNPGGMVGRIYRRTPPAAQQAPTLDWTGEAGYSGDGADPDSAPQGTVFHFRVKYTDANHDLPTSIQVWLDLDNDGYEEDEKHDLWEADFDDHDTADGKVYRKLLEVNAAPDTYNYRFYARDRNGDATGAPVTTGDSIIVTAVANQAPVLSWTGEAGYESDGVDPEYAVSGSTFTFRVEYTDDINVVPNVSQVWIDLNDDGDFNDTDEKQAMTVDGGDGDYTNGEIFTLSDNIPYPSGSVNGTINYKFYFEDSDSVAATGDPTSALTLTVRESLSSCNRTVCSSSCTDTTIQAAVDNSSDGQNVCVYDGTWAPFSFNGKDITVRSVNGPAVTTIDGGGSGNVVSYNTYSSTGSDATLKGFTVRNGNQGVYVNNSQAIIADCIIEDNSSAGISADNGSADPIVIDGAIIRNNTGPGIQNVSSSFTATVIDTVFTGNTAGSGAALYGVNGAGTLTFAGCEFSNNQATSGDGGAISFGGSVNINLSDSTVIGNTASGDGGGIFIYGTPGIVINVDRTVFAGNQAANGAGIASGPGGGIFTFTNCIFSGNYASGNGGGMMTSESSSATNMFMNCTLSGNSAENGGGIYSKIWNTAGLKVHNSIIWGNESRASDNNQVEGPIILDPGSIYYAEVKYSDIGLDQRYSVFTNQVGNMYVDPQFVDPIPASSAPTTDGDYHLLAPSPVIDQALAASPPAVDINGEVRPNPASVDIDMGADEYYPSVDLDETGAGTATAVAVDETTINISMPYGKDFNGDNAYTIEYKLSSSGTWLDWGANPKAHTASPYTDTITGLTTGETYDVRMTYIDPDGVNGANPQTITVVVLDYETTVGTAAAAMASVTSIAVSMPYTFDDNNDNTYTVEYKLSSSGTWLDWETNPKANIASPYTDIITGLTTGETYDVRMTYNDTDGVNGTNPQTVTSILLSADATSAGTATATGASDTSITVAMPYTFDNNIDNTYTVDYKCSITTGGSWTNWVTGDTHTASPYTNTITGLTPGEICDVRMTYIDGDGVTGSNPQTVTGIALTHNSTTVGTATAAAQGETGIDVSMPYTGDDNGDNTYTVKYKLSSSGTWLDWGTNPKAHAASPYTDTITGLTPGETYDVQMTYNDADNVNGTNPQTITGIVLTHNSTTVGTATAVKASDTSIDVSMPYTGDDNGDNTYTVEYKLSSSGTWLDWGTNPKAHTATPFTDTITGLATGTYDVQMTYNDTDNVNGTNPQTVTGIVLSSFAPDVYVCSGETYTTIQAGINAATDGQTVGVCEGTYSENITFSAAKNITVIAEGVVANTIIQGTSGNNAAVVTFSNGTVDNTTVLEGFTIDNQANSSATRGVAISNGASPTINSCIIENNKSDNNNGAGLLISGTNSGATITSSTISNNTTGVNQGYGGGISHSGTGTLTISDSSIVSNDCKRSGGGLYMSSGSAVITGTSINSNIAGGSFALQGGGGILTEGTANLTLSKSRVLGNKTSGTNDDVRGGGIRINSGATATITNSIIAGNITTGYRNDGAGIYNNGTLYLYFSTITDNYCQRSGGGLQADGTETVRNSIIWGNYNNLNIGGTIETTDNNYTAGDPLFVNRSQASSGSPTVDGDYHLCNGSGDPDGACVSGPSPCIDSGNTTNAPADDIDGGSRPYNTLYDRGADEYGVP